MGTRGPSIQETSSLLEHVNTLVEEAKTQVAPQVIATSSESESEADSEACSSVISEAEKFSGAVIVGNVKSGKYHRADEDHPELVLPACHAGKLHYECIDAENFTMWRESRPSSACCNPNCFMAPSRETFVCNHICGFIQDGSICFRRCKELHDCGFPFHDCWEHGSKKPKVA